MRRSYGPRSAVGRRAALLLQRLLVGRPRPGANSASVSTKTCSPQVRLDHEVVDVGLRPGWPRPRSRRAPGLRSGSAAGPGSTRVLYGVSVGELGLGQLLVVVAERVADRRVDPERVARLQPVVDHRRDELALLGHLDLALDHRGDDQHVVGGQVLRLRVGEVDAGEVAAGRPRAAATTSSLAVAFLAIVGRREQEALEVGRVLGAVLPRGRSPWAARRSPSGSRP